MTIEGNPLIVVLIIAALVICAIGVYIRMAMTKNDESDDKESLFGRLLRFRGGGDEDEAAEDEAEAAPKPKVASEPSPAGLGGMFGGMLGSRKSKEQIKEEVKAIDDQLNSVLQETEEINVTAGLSSPQISPDAASTLSDGLGMKELDLQMGAIPEPLEILNSADLKTEPAIEMAAPPVAPAAAPPAEPEKKSEAPAAEQSKAIAEVKVDATDSKADSLLADLEESTKQVDEVDLSIMKEYEGMPIACIEIETELKDILEQITIDPGHRR